MLHVPSYSDIYPLLDSIDCHVNVLLKNRIHIFWGVQWLHVFTYASLVPCYAMIWFCKCYLVPFEVIAPSEPSENNGAYCVKFKMHARSSCVFSSVRWILLVLFCILLSTSSELLFLEKCNKCAHSCVKIHTWYSQMCLVP